VRKKLILFTYLIIIILHIFYHMSSETKQEEVGVAMVQQKMPRKSRANKDDFIPYIDQRQVNIDKLIAAGINCYPHIFKTTCTFDEFITRYEHLIDEEVFETKTVEHEDGTTEEVGVERICGRIMELRLCGNLFFYQLQGDHGHRKLQVMARKNNYHDVTKFKLLQKNINRGDIVGITGCATRTKTGELSILAHEIQLLAPCFHMLPKSFTTLKDKETRFRNRPLDMIVNPRTNEVLIQRSKIIQYLRTFLIKRDFIEVETPMLHKVHGGAAAKPFKTYYNALEGEYSLRIAPELHLKRLIVGGLERVFEINRNFRNESCDLTHNPEFTSCELYQANADYNDLMDMTEKLLGELVLDINGSYLIKFTDIAGTDHEIDFTPPFQRVDMMSTLEEKIGAKFPENYESPEMREFLLAHCKTLEIPVSTEAPNSKLLDKLVEYCIEKNCVNPTFVINHPQFMSPLAKWHRDDSRLTERFELFVAHTELCNAYTELNDPKIQRQLFMDQTKQKDVDDEYQPYDEDYCQALEYGLVPTAGWGIGIDRLVMFLTNNANIREVIAFPMLRDT
jgi:lysyl-tRNA synthetase, class II